MKADCVRFDILPSTKKASTTLPLQQSGIFYEVFKLPMYLRLLYKLCMKKCPIEGSHCDLPERKIYVILLGTLQIVAKLRNPEKGFQYRCENNAYLSL